MFKRSILFCLISMVLLGISTFCFAYDSSSTVSPGETGSIILKAINKPESIGSMKWVKIEIPNPPNWFIVKGTSLLGPQVIQVGNAYAFKIDFEIAQNAPSGAFNVAINILMDTPNSEPLYWYTLHLWATLFSKILSISANLC